MFGKRSPNQQIQPAAPAPAVTQAARPRVRHRLLRLSPLHSRPRVRAHRGRRRVRRPR